MLRSEKVARTTSTQASRGLKQCPTKNRKMKGGKLHHLYKTKEGSFPHSTPLRAKAPNRTSHLVNQREDKSQRMRMEPLPSQPIIEFTQ